MTKYVYCSFINEPCKAERVCTSLHVWLSLIIEKCVIRIVIRINLDCILLCPKTQANEASQWSEEKNPFSTASAIHWSVRNGPNRGTSRKKVVEIKLMSLPQLCSVTCSTILFWRLSRKCGWILERKIYRTRTIGEI